MEINILTQFFDHFYIYRWHRIFLLSATVYKETLKWRHVRAAFYNNFRTIINHMDAEEVEIWAKAKGLSLRVPHSINHIQAIVNDVSQLCNMDSQLDKFKAVVRVYSISRRTFGDKYYKFIKNLIEDNQIDSLEWVINTFGLEKDRLLQREPYILHFAAKHGSTLAIDWLANHFNLDANDIVKDQVVLDYAISWNNFDTLKWFVSRFDLDRNDFVDSTEILDTAAINNRLQIMKWLIKNVGLGRFDTVRENVIETAVWNGRFAMVRWVIEEFQFAKEEIRLNVLLRDAIDRRSWNIFKWLVNYYNIGKETRLYYSNQYVLIRMFKYEDTNLANWFIDRFDVQKERIMMYDSGAFYRALTVNNIFTLKFLIREYCITSRDVDEMYKQVKYGCIPIATNAKTRALLAELL